MKKRNKHYQTLHKLVNISGNSKFVFFFVAVFLAAVILLNYVNTNIYKSRAGVDDVTVSFNPNKTTILPGEEFNLDILLAANEDKKISGVSLAVEYDKNSDLIEYQSGSIIETPGGYFDDTVLELVESNWQDAKLLKVTLTAKKQDLNLNSTINIRLKFKAKDQSGPVNFRLVKEYYSQVVGTATNHIFTIVPDVVETTITVADSLVDNPTPTLIADEPDMTLQLKLKFQGITTQPKDEFNNLRVKVTIIDVNTKTHIGYGDFVAHGAIWEGSIPFDGIVPSSSARIFIKGPKHLQREICTVAPLETGIGDYKCEDNTTGITLVNGENSFDFSGIYQPAGDVPFDGTNQDGLLDSIDFSFLRGNFGSKNADILHSGDFNLDGIVDTQDYALPIAVYGAEINEDEGD